MPLLEADALEVKAYEYCWKDKRYSRVKLKFACSECGKEFWVEKTKRDLLTHRGKCRSCTSRQNMKGINRTKRPFEWLYNRLLTHCARYDRVCTLTYNDFLHYTTISECHYCGSSIHWYAFSGSMGGHYHGYNLDRKDNDRGYEKDNVVVCCGACNTIKNNHLSYDEMMMISPQLRLIMERRRTGC